MVSGGGGWPWAWAWAYFHTPLPESGSQSGNLARQARACSRRSSDLRLSEARSAPAVDSGRLVLVPTACRIGGNGPESVANGRFPRAGRDRQAGVYGNKLILKGKYWKGTPPSAGIWKDFRKGNHSTVTIRILKRPSPQRECISGC